MPVEPIASRRPRGALQRYCENTARQRAAQNCKCIGPDPAAGWLDERQRYCGGNCGISGITATCDHLQPGLSGKRLACGYHVVGHNRRASGRVVMMCAKLHLDPNWQPPGSLMCRHIFVLSKLPGARADAGALDPDALALLPPGEGGAVTVRTTSPQAASSA